MKYRFRWVYISVLLLVALGLTGCIGSRGEDASEELSLVMGKYMENWKNLDADGIADMYTFPVTLINSTGNTVTVDSRSELLTSIRAAFRQYTAVHDYAVSVTRAFRTGNTATARVSIVIEATVNGKRGFGATEIDMKYRLVNGEWKIYRERVRG